MAPARFIPILFAFTVMLALPFPALGRVPAQEAHVRAELIAEVASIRPGVPFRVAVHLRMEPGWHTYWRNPGSSGQATSIAWTLPEGFSAGPIQWPFPARIEQPPLVSYGYEHEVSLITEITPPATLRPGSFVEIAAGVKWLECKELCLPGSAALARKLPVGVDTAVVPAPALFETAALRIPVTLTDWHLTATVVNGRIILSITPPPGRTDAWREGLFFFDETGNVVDPAAPQTITNTGGGAALELKTSEYANGTITSLAGVLVNKGGWDTTGRLRGMTIDLPITPEYMAAPRVAAPRSGLGGIALAAFLGGIILNLMPCVFPVLSLKVLGFLDRAADLRRLRRSAIAYTVGVLISFWALAALLMLFRAAGEEIGWGFQLQSPDFVIAMCFLFTILALNLFGVFEWSGAWTGLGGALADRGGVAGAFWSGVLATVVATPCTAPFMGSALGVAVLMPAPEAALVFTALGSGFALPYLALAWFPRWVRVLPRPGAWMETFKQMMAFPLLVAVIWLVGVYGKLTDADRAEHLLGGLLLAGIAAWTMGRWATPIRKSGVRWAATLGALALLVGGVSWARSHAKVDGWEVYSSARVERLIAEGRPVFIDFTAAWCVTCQVNKQTTLHSSVVERAFRERNVATLVADWTRQDPEITRALASYGRNAVPTYVLYPGGGIRDAILLPEILTPSILLNALEEIPRSATNG